MREYQVVCIDDDDEFLSSLESAVPDKVRRLCSDFDLVFDFVASPDELFEVLATDSDGGPAPAMVISDQVMPGTSGIDLIERLKRDHPDIACVLLTGHAGLDSARYAINNDLLDQYVTKPIEDAPQFASLLANLLQRHHLKLEERERTAQLARAVDQLRETNERIRAMHAAAEQVAVLSKGLKSLDFDEVVEMVTQQVPKIFKAEWGVLCFPENGCPAANATRAHRHACPCPTESLVARDDALDACRQGEILLGDIPFVCEKLGGAPPGVVVPLSAEVAMDAEDAEAQPPTGYLCMCRIAPSMASSPELILYQAALLRDVLSANLTNARLYQEARRRSQIDALTGVSTRRVMEEKLADEYDRAVRYQRPFCVAVVDVDRFKRVNDTLGHDEGDRALRELAKVLQAEARQTDILARYGGDEFVVLMPETDLDAAVDAAERLRGRMESVAMPGGQTLTVSCGVAQWSSLPADAGSDVLRRADAALYEAKRSGRNRVAAAPSARAAG